MSSALRGGLCSSASAAAARARLGCAAAGGQAEAAVAGLQCAGHLSFVLPLPQAGRLATAAVSRIVASKRCYSWLRPLTSAAISISTSTASLSSSPSYRRPQWQASIPPRHPPVRLSQQQHRSARTAASPPPPPRVILVSYNDLPYSYQDEKGLPFRQKDLNKNEVITIFGSGIETKAANHLLRILHGRRVAGTLDDPAFRVNTARFRPVEIDKGLAYLRRTLPVDEVLNAGLCAEDELAAIEAEEEDADAQEKDRDAAGAASGAPPAKSSQWESKWRARLFKDAPAEDVYGVGAFDTIRASNKVKYEKKERLRQELEAQRRAEQEKEWAELGESSGRHLQTMPDGTTRLVPALAQRKPSAQMQKWMESGTSPLQEPPRMSKAERLWPSYVFVLSLLAGGAVVSSFYDAPAKTTQPAAEQDRPADFWGRHLPSFFPPMSEASATVLTLVAANVAVFILWRVPPLWSWMNRYMIVVPATPRPASMVGAVFSHQKAGHLLANSLFLYFLGVRLHEEVGRAHFLECYLASGSLAFVASLTNIVLRNNLHLTTLGASGAIYGIATAYFMMHKYEGFKILDLPPDPYNGIQGMGFIGIMLGLNLLTLRAEKQAVDVVTHFAGMAVGAVFGECFRVQQDEQTRAAAEGREPRRLLQLLFDTVTGK